MRTLMTEQDNKARCNRALMALRALLVYLIEQGNQTKDGNLRKESYTFITRRDGARKNELF